MSDDRELTAIFSRDVSNVAVGVIGGAGMVVKYGEIEAIGFGAILLVVGLLIPVVVHTIRHHQSEVAER